MSPLAPQPHRPAANGGCRSASNAMIGEITVPGCRPRSRARQSAQRTSPGWSRRCCRTMLSVRLKSMTGSLANRARRHDSPSPPCHGRPPYNLSWSLESERTGISRRGVRMGAWRTDGQAHYLGDSAHAAAFIKSRISSAWPKCSAACVSTFDLASTRVSSRRVEFRAGKGKERGLNPDTEVAPMILEGGRARAAPRELIVPTALGWLAAQRPQEVLFGIRQSVKGERVKAVRRLGWRTPVQLLLPESVEDTD